MPPRRPVDPARGAGGDPARPGAPRRLVGRYRLDAELGRGAMGTVWRAYDEVLHRPVAVKEVRLSSVPVSERAVVRERTLREARATAMLSHPNVVTLYDVVEVDAEPYVVMELLPSRSLAAQIMEDGPLPAAEAAAVGSAVASALITAHRAGITHRDVKPGNVLIGGPGQIKLTDFGIARNAAESSMTQTGTVLGSPPYIAPEVAMGRGVGPAADLWGLGATLFACVEGRPPYDAGNPVSTVSEVVHGDVPLPTGHGPVVDVIRGLMVKDPALRMPLGAVRRRLRPALPRPEDAGVPGVSGAPAGRTPAPPPPDSDHSGLIPIPRTRPLPDADSAPLPEPVDPDAGPATADSPEAHPDPSGSLDAVPADEGGAAPPPAGTADAGPAGGDGPDGAKSTVVPEDDDDGAVRPHAGDPDAAEAGAARPGAPEGADVSAPVRALPAADAPDDGPVDGLPAAGDAAAPAGDRSGAASAVAAEGAPETGEPGDGTDGADGAPGVVESTPEPVATAPGAVDEEVAAVEDRTPDPDDAATDEDEVDPEEDPPDEDPTDEDPTDEDPTDEEDHVAIDGAAAAGTAGGDEPDGAVEEPADAGPSAAEATRVVSVPSTAARTTVTPTVGADGPTRRVPRRTPARPAPPTPAAPWPSVPPPPRAPARAGETARAPGAGPGLAADPGPLPFAPRPGAAPPPTRTVAAVVALLVVLAILGALIGYALVRALGA